MTNNNEVETGLISAVAVIGAGQMGTGIAQVCATCELEVRLSDATLERAQAGIDAIAKSTQRLVDKERLSAAQRDSLLARLRAASTEEAAAGAQLAIEAASEDPELKRRLFRTLDQTLPTGSILATNTSSISISQLAAETKRPERVVGMHFMNPVPLMKLVEIVAGIRTSAATLASIEALAQKLGKVTIRSRDFPGFIVNRMLIPFLNEACFALQEGVASAADIDAGARQGLNHPLGPLELADLIGLDTVLAISEVLLGEFNDSKYRPATLLKNLVSAGWLGKKSGVGFYRYDERGKKLGPTPLTASESAARQ